MRCDIRDHAQPPQHQPAGCGQDCGGATAIGRSRTACLLCAGNTIANPVHPVLPQGAAWQGDGVVCTASEGGVRCGNGTRRGFSLSRAGLSIL